VDVAASSTARNIEPCGCTLSLLALSACLKGKHSGTQGIPGWNSQVDFEGLPWYSKSSSFLSLKKVPRPIKVRVI